MNPNGINAGDGTPGNALVEKDGTFYCAWCDQRGTGTGTQDVYFAKSTDDGATFSVPTRVDLGDAPNSSDSEAVFLAVADNGNIVAVFETDRDSLAAGSTTEDIFYNVSTDGGVTWMPTSLPLNAATAGSNIATDVDLPWLTVSGNTFHCIWEEEAQAGAGEEEVYYARSTDAGITWSTAVALSSGTGNDDVDDPKVVAEGDTVIVAYIDMQDDVRTFRSTDGGASFAPSQIAESDPSGNANNPQIQMMGDVVLLAWNEDDAITGDEEVRCAVSTDGGVSYQAEVLLSEQIALFAGGLGGAAGNTVYAAYSNDGGASWTKDVPVTPARPPTDPPSRSPVTTSSLPASWGSTSMLRPSQCRPPSTEVRHGARP